MRKLIECGSRVYTEHTCLSPMHEDPYDSDGHSPMLSYEECTRRRGRGGRRRRRRRL